MTLTPYLMFAGNAEEALEFYAKALGATEAPAIMRYSDAPGSDTPGDYGNKILHASLTFPGGTLYFSDALPTMEVRYSDSLSFNLGPDSEEQMEQLFADLSSGGIVVDPISVEFWGDKYGALKDKFGIHWSINYELPKE